MSIHITPGLRPLPPDERDFQLGAITTLPDPKTIPDFTLAGPYLNYETQEEDDCTAFAVCKASELQEGVLLDRKFQFALSKSKSGDPEEWGQDIRTALLTPVKLGSLERSQRPRELEGKPLSYLRYLTKWGDIEKLLKLSVLHRKKSAVFITPAQGMDYFDTIIASMWKFRDENRAVVFGTTFDIQLSEPFIRGPLRGGYGHSMLFIGKKTINGVPYLIAQNHYPGYAGDNGVHYLDRERVNASAGKFGAGMFIDYSQDEIKWMMENGLKIEDNWLKGILIAIIRALIDLKNRLLAIKKEETGHVPSPYLLPAIIWQESNGDDNAVGDNGNAYGCLQIWQSYMSDVYKWRSAKECLGNRKLSIDVFQKYMARYATEKRLGRPVTDQDIARIHNAGPDGWKKDIALPYWWSVQAKMKKLEAGQVEPTLLEKIMRVS
jgi:hypothetical protein